MKKTFESPISAQKSLSILVKTSEFLRFCASNPPPPKFSGSATGYCPTSLNPADVASRPGGVKKPEVRRCWYEGPDFLKQNVNEPVIAGPSVSVKRMASGQEFEEFYFPDNSQLDKLIESSPSLYVLTKRVAYLAAFVDNIRCKSEKS